MSNIIKTLDDHLSYTRKRLGEAEKRSRAASFLDGVVFGLEQAIEATKVKQDEEIKRLQSKIGELENELENYHHDDDPRSMGWVGDDGLP